MKRYLTCLFLVLLMSVVFTIEPGYSQGRKPYKVEELNLAAWFKDHKGTVHVQWCVNSFDEDRPCGQFHITSQGETYQDFLTLFDRKYGYVQGATALRVLFDADMRPLALFPPMFVKLDDLGEADYDRYPIPTVPGELP